MASARPRVVSESGQMLPLIGMLLFIIIGLLGLAVDVGHIYTARAQLGRSVDAAALAGAQQLPDVVKADAKARAFIAANDPDATIAVSVYPNVPSQQVGVSATKTVHTFFMRVFGYSTVQVTNDALAGFGTVPVDAVMGIDATGSMHNSPCTSATDSTTHGCPIKEAKDAATAFVNTLLPSSATQVGMYPYRGCFNPPDGDSTCIATSKIQNLTTSASTINTKIAAVDSTGGSGTNTCLALLQGDTTLFGPGHSTASNTRRYLVLLTDGDNVYNNVSYVSGSAPPTACRPSSSQNSDTYVGTQCSLPGQGATSSSNPGSNSMAKERELDILGKTESDVLKAAGVEIYVVALSVCGGTEDGSFPTTSYCANIGNTDPDNIADQRTLKCVASSSPGTNDHYYRTDDATQLPGIFSAIAHNIAFRLIK